MSESIFSQFGDDLIMSTGPFVILLLLLLLLSVQCVHGSNNASCAYGGGGDGQGAANPLPTRLHYVNSSHVYTSFPTLSQKSELGEKRTK